MLGAAGSSAISDTFSHSLFGRRNHPSASLPLTSSGFSLPKVVRWPPPCRGNVSEVWASSLSVLDIVGGRGLDEERVVRRLAGDDEFSGVTAVELPHTGYWRPALHAIQLGVIVLINPATNSTLAIPEPSPSSARQRTPISVWSGAGRVGTARGGILSAWSWPMVGGVRSRMNVLLLVPYSEAHSQTTGQYFGNDLQSFVLWDVDRAKLNSREIRGVALELQQAGVDAGQSGRRPAARWQIPAAVLRPIRECDRRRQNTWRRRPAPRLTSSAPVGAGGQYARAHSARAAARQSFGDRRGRGESEPGLRRAI